jgi:hypothetical protein
MDTTSLRDAYRALLDAAAATVATLVLTLLLSNDTVLVDQPVSLRDLITGLADVELPGHTEQLLALLPDGAAFRSATAQPPGT